MSVMTQCSDATQFSESRVRTGFEIVGRSQQAEILRRRAKNASETRLTVLIQGETGTGKDHIAKYIHSIGPKKPWIRLNCGSLAETLMESELFGHTSTAFTGAGKGKPGLLETAGDGTAFLDEVGNIRIDVQQKFLDVLELQPLKAVGSLQWFMMKARILAATNMNLEAAVKNDTFRADLYHRLNVATFTVPPLRDRREDIPDFIGHFLREIGSKATFLPETVEVMQKYDWPGNIRELEGTVKSLVEFHARGEAEIGPDAVRDLLRGVSDRVTTPRTPGDFDKEVADYLYRQMVEDGCSFWSVVYEPYMKRDLTRSHIRALVRRGLTETHGNYKIVTRLYNMEPTEYKRFLNFLRKHECQLPFHQFR